jgi:hypothetical protein
LDKYRDIEIQYKILSKLFNIDNKLEILEYIYKSAEYIKLFENKRFKLYPLIFPNISVNFIIYGILFLNLIKLIQKNIIIIII